MAAYDEDSVLRRGRGRPVEADARRKIVSVRFNEAELDMIEHLEIETGMNATEIIRKAVRTLYPIELNRL